MVRTFGLTHRALGVENVERAFGFPGGAIPVRARSRRISRGDLVRAADADRPALIATAVAGRHGQA
jgi:hypothetical protein